MKLANIRGLFLLLLALLAGCAAAPTQEELAAADYGRDMTAAECISIAQQVIANSLKDPSSAQFRDAPCYKGGWGSIPVMGLKKVFGWVQKGEVNAKNSFGGYVGFRPYQVLIKDGAVIRFCIADENGACVPS